jgi:hypothetical protein
MLLEHLGWHGQILRSSRPCPGSGSRPSARRVRTALAGLFTLGMLAGIPLIDRAGRRAGAEDPGRPRMTSGLAAPTSADGDGA